jgi:hypothetical protein
MILHGVGGQLALVFRIESLQEMLDLQAAAVVSNVNTWSSSEDILSRFAVSFIHFILTFELFFSYCD